MQPDPVAEPVNQPLPRTLGAAADVLAGADGIGSAARRQHLPEKRGGDLGLVGMAGLVPFEEALRRTSQSRSGRDSRACWPQTARMGSSPSPSRGRRLRTGPKEEADHLIWVLITTRATYGRDPRPMFDLGAALKRLALTLTEGWHSDLRRLSDSRSVRTRTVALTPARVLLGPDQLASGGPRNESADS